MSVLLLKKGGNDVIIIIINKKCLWYYKIIMKPLRALFNIFIKIRLTTVISTLPSMHS